MKITKKELFKFCDENNDAINELQSRSDNTDFLLAVLIQQLKDSGVIDEISPEPKPQLKQLDQSVFDGLDEKWRFAAIDLSGEAWVYREQPKIDKGDDRWSPSNTPPNSIGTGYDTSNWQNSLIERSTAKELLEVDLSSELTGSDLARAMFARGATMIMCAVSNSHDQKRAITKQHEIDIIHDLESFVSSTHPYVGFQNSYRYATPINNQGEPLTANEVGL